MKTLARTIALVAALTTGGAAVAHHTAHACGGYVITEAERVHWALQAFLGEMSQRVSFGAAKITAAEVGGPVRAAITIEMDTAAGKRRAKAQQTFLLEKRDGAWKVVDWTFPVAAPAKVAAKVVARR